MRRGTPEPDLDQALARNWPAVWHQQKFSVGFEFPVVFTSGLFDPENPVLVDILSRIEADKQHRCIVFVDEGILAVRPTLPSEIRTYAAPPRAIG